MTSNKKAHRRASKNVAAKKGEEEHSPPSSTPAEAASTPSLSNHFRNLAMITIVIAAPYAAWVSYLYIHLQSGLLRAPLPVSSPRQLLIVGTQSSGTTEMASNLQALGLEVAHESSDAMWSFARDGTVSWLHMLRFMPGVAAESTLLEMCGSSRRNMGFHPAMFRVPRRGCSYRQQWDTCWRRECLEIIDEEWGCAARTAASATAAAEKRPAGWRTSAWRSATKGVAAAGAAPSGACETPFARTLLQVRHPLRVAESLSVKFCESLDAQPHAHLRAFLRALWPAHPWDSLSCAATAAWYWTLYNEAMLAAHRAGRIHSWYRVEQSSACGVAREAGFLEPSTSVDAGSHQRAEAACTASQDATGGSVKLDAPPPGRKRKNQVNKGRLNLTLGDVVQGADAGGVTKDLEARMRKLAKEFGYQV